jgi:hypothetical protein
MPSLSIGAIGEAAALNPGDSRLPSLFVSAYPWNLMERGLDGLLDRLRGEVGVTGLSVWAATPPLKQFRVRDVLPRLFRTDGGVFFQPSDRHGSGAACRPLVSTWTRGGNPLATIAEQCVRSDVRLRAILPAATTGQLALRYPEFACRNAFDDESGSAICLANPDVQEYLVGLATDIATNYPVQGLVLADFSVSWREAFSREILVTAPLGDAERSVLSTCFCGACVRASESAGVDVHEARDRVRAIIDQTLSPGVHAERNPPRMNAGDRGILDGLLADQPALAEHRRIQTEQLNALLRRLVETCRVEVLLSRATNDPASAGPTGLDHRIPAGVLTRAESVERLSGATAANARRNEVWVAASWAIGAGAAEFVGAVSQAAQLGFAGIDIDNYGILPDAAFTTIKQAIRFARRSAGA